MSKIKWVVLFHITTALISAQSNLLKSNSPYFGQKPPGEIPELFAPGIVSTQHHEHSSLAVSPDGKEIMWNSNFWSNSFRFPIKILSVRADNGNWALPEFSYYFGKLENHSCSAFSPDGKRIYFSSTGGLNSVDTSYGRGDIWYIEKDQGKWSMPVHLDSTINSKHTDTTPSVTKDLTLYYMGYLENVRNNYGIFRSKYVEGKYQKPEALPVAINSEELDWTPFIAPDESYLLFSSFREGGYGAGDLYISFRNENDEWSEPINLGNKINTENNERFPGVSPDGKYLFFLTDKVSDELLNKKNQSYSELKTAHASCGNGFCDIYWVDAGTIKELKSKSNKYTGE